ASDWDGAPLMLMSTLSRHTRNLALNPHASLLLTGRAERGDPLNHPRVTLGGRVEGCPWRVAPATLRVTLGGRVEGWPEPRAKVRYLQRNPKATLYAGFADFALFRLRVESVHFNGGFGR